MLGLTLFSVIMLLIMMNLMIAIMSEAIEEVKRIARARWCFEQVRMNLFVLLVPFISPLNPAAARLSLAVTI